MGVSILPKFAATVSITAIGISLSDFPDIFNVVTVNGTKVMSATSFVIIIAQKKQSSPKISERPVTLLTFERSFSAMNLKTPSLFKPAITAIKQKSKPNVRKSIY